MRRSCVKIINVIDMNAPYFCIKCGRQHVRGVIYTEHLGSREHDPTTCHCTDCHPIKVYLIQKEIDNAAIPQDIQPTVIINGVVEKWEPRVEFQKRSSCPDRVVEAMTPNPGVKIEHGKPIMKRHWWNR